MTGTLFMTGNILVRHHAAGTVGEAPVCEGKGLVCEEVAPVCEGEGLGGVEGGAWGVGAGAGF